MFIISPRNGLCNQLQTIINGILLGIKYNRNIYLDKFQINAYSNVLVDINEIINIPKINDYLLTHNINIIILNKLDVDVNEYKLINIDYTTIPIQKCINHLIEEYIDQEIIYLGNIVSLDMYESFNYRHDDYTNLYYSLMSNLVFHDKFYKLKEEIKKN